MESKIFSYKAEGIILGPANDNFKVSPVFDRKELLEKMREWFKKDNFTVDEHSLNYKIEDGQLFVQGIAFKQQEPSSIGFMKSN